MSRLLNNTWMPIPVFAPENDGGGAAPAADAPTAGAEASLAAGAGTNTPADAPAKDTASVLYPDDKPAGTADAAPAWAEYSPDPAKSEAENAAAKAEHDKTKPGEAAAADPGDVVPEDGKYALTMPEGVDVDQPLLDALGPKFKELGLTTKQAQGLAEAYAAQKKSEFDARSAEYAATVSGWIDQAKKDDEIGGGKWDRTASEASKVIDKFGTPALKAYLNETGGGNHPELIRFAARVGAAISDDDPARGENRGTKTEADPAKRLYPNDPPRGA